MRGRKVRVGETHATLYARHSKKCSVREDSSGTVGCKCIRWIQFSDGKRESTCQWTWAKAEEEARRLISERTGTSAVAPEKTANYSVKTAIDEWIAEREHDGIRNNNKAKYLAAKLLSWCQRNGIEYLNQIQKHGLRMWRMKEWRYRAGDSNSLKVHWSILSAFFNWCVEGDLIETNVCPKIKGKIEQKEVVPLAPQQMNALETAVEKMRTPGWTDQRRLKMRALILIMRWSGMSIHDAVHLERDANAVIRLIGKTVYGKRSKTKKKFSVTIPDSVVNLLQSLPPDHHRYFFWHKRRDGSELRSMVQMFGGWYADVFKMAGITGHSHQLRHSFATYHLSRGVPVERVAEWMGDSVTEVMRTYGHWIPERQEQSDRAMRDSWAKMGLDEAGNPIDVPTNNTVQ